jgi:hypothetical protein
MLLCETSSFFSQTKCRRLMAEGEDQGGETQPNGSKRTYTYPPYMLGLTLQ